MEEIIGKLEKEILKIKERNLRVESDKAWETSVTRIISVALITYIVAAVLLYLIGTKNFLLNALIPTVGFFLSNQTLPVIKKLWLTKFFNQKDRAQREGSR